MSKVIKAILVAVMVMATVTVHGTSLHKGDDRTGNLHAGNGSSASLISIRSVHDEEIRKANDRALASLSPSPHSTITTLTPGNTWTLNFGLIALLLFAVLAFLGYIIVAGVSKEPRPATPPVPPLPLIPPVEALSLDELKFQTATLIELRNGIVPHHYNLSGFLPHKGESVIWAFHGVKRYRLQTHSEWVGRSAGLNVRVARGVWIRTGASHGHSILHSSVASEVGTLVFTTTALCFVGANSVRIPFSHILAFNTYTDGFGLHTDYARNSEQIFGGIHSDNVMFLKTALGLLHADAPL
jgi:hypothetical protein